MSVVTFTRSLMVAEVRRQLQQKVGGLFDGTDFNRWFDLAVADVASRARCVRTDATAASVSAQQGYTLDVDCVGAWGIAKVTYAGVRLEHHSWDTIEDVLESGLALSSSGTPKYWSPYGRSIYLTPIPNAAGDEIGIWYPKKPVAASADSVALDDLGIPEVYAPAIETFMRHRGLLLAGDEQTAMAAWQLYEHQLGLESRKDVDNVADDVARGAG